MVISIIISPLIGAISIMTLLITPLITSHEPPSGVAMRVLSRGTYSIRLKSACRKDPSSTRVYP